ncbi:MAG: DinB family protein [Actinomycetota bacterium]
MTIQLPSLAELLVEYDRALGYTADLVSDLTDDEVVWRADAEASAIGWHLGHQAAVAHYMVRNLTAAEPEIDPPVDRLMDSATLERDRGDLPPVATIHEYRSTVAERVRFRIGNIDEGKVGAPAQLRLIGTTLLIAVINHEYQHSKWIGEVREQVHGKALPDAPSSQWLTSLDDYVVVAAAPTATV